MSCSQTNEEFSCVRLTAVGPVGLKWSLFDHIPGVTRILLTNPAKDGGMSPDSWFPGCPWSSCREIEIILDQIEAFTGGEEIQFSLRILRLRDCSAFQQKALLAEAGIPRGKVSSYGHISAQLGVPGGARAVGTALATNPFPLVIPCHRAIRSDGSLGGFQGGLKMKRLLLEMEGLHFDVRNRVENPVFYYC